jgi:hypothetical protein
MRFQIENHVGSPANPLLPWNIYPPDRCSTLHSPIPSASLSSCIAVVDNDRRLRGYPQTSRLGMFASCLLLIVAHDTLQTLQAGPSTSPQSTLKKKSSMSFLSASAAALAAAKRKRTDTPDETSADSTSNPSRKPRDGPKKKKANRACYHCQKAHLTCDDCEFLDISPQSLPTTPVQFSLICISI